MANYLNFDIYDLELTDLRTNSYLRRVLLSTRNRSILVLEDIDCSFEFKNSRQVLPRNFDLPPGTPRIIDFQVSTITIDTIRDANFIDGLWLSIGDERIIVFTTNNKDILDPALLRPGRMDVHIHMSFCIPSGFRLLAYNYLKGESVAEVLL
ncbi:Aaa-atpase [Thalictrum thalictroides]|uniref:Aaa-atpase n=1 Tax=Thalictrum thalictroides TaxID=46969 RepID=A0A7J6V086_THATH|nr:Aaa-atpase [Thalictrum thalictroides]